MSDTESSSSSSSRCSSPSSSPETPKKIPKSQKSSPDIPEVPKSPKNSPETPEVPKSAKSPPELPEEAPKSSIIPPKMPKKVLQSSKNSPETPEVPNSSITPPEVPNKVSKSSKTPPEVPPKKVPKSSTSSPETPGSPKSPKSPPEVPKKVSKFPNSSLENSEDPKSPKTPPEVPKKVKRSPVPPVASEAPQIPPCSPEAPKKVQKFPISSPESLEDDPKSPTGEPKAPPKKLRGSFKSSLQVFLHQKHDTELQKTIDYKDKLEREEVEEDDDLEEEERSEGSRGSVDGRMDKEDKEGKKEMIKQELNQKDELARNVKPTKTRKEEVSETNKTKESKAKPEQKSEIEKEMNPKNRKENNQDGKKNGNEKRASEEKAKVTKEEEEKDKKIAEKEREKSEEMTTEKKEDKKQPERKIEKAKDKNKDHETEEMREVKKEENTKEVTKKERAQEEERKKETREASAEKEEKKKKEEEQEMSTRKKERIKDERPQGHLYLKKKRTFNRWKQYYFVLDGLLLTYYRSQHEYERIRHMKGSLDLSLVDDVHAKKPGMLRTHHPFCLARRTLPSINLAADTKDEQERWMEVLKTAVGPLRLSCCSSDRTLNSGTSLAKCDKRFSTLPARPKDVISYSSSVTEEDDDEEERKEEEEEEPELIKPKKVARVPIGMPLVNVNFGQVKLKKVEKVEREDVEEGKAADVPSSPTSSHEGHKPKDHSRETSPSELFGVVLKKTKNKEEEEKESPKESGGARDGSVSPGNTSSNRRPLKQPVIPLNSRKLLVVPEVKEAKSPRVSPATQKRTTVDRRKSPSPSLPISKSVQALTKSAEEVRPTQVDTVSLADTTTSAEGKGKDDYVKVCHAQTSEVKYIDVLDIVDVEEVTESVIKAVVEKEGSKEEVQKALKGDERQTEKEEDMEKVPLDTSLKVDEGEEEDKNENKEVVPVPVKEEALDEKTFGEDSANMDSQQVEVSTKEHKQCESSSVEEKIGESEASPDTLPESSSVATPLTPPASPASSVASTDSEIVPTFSSEPVPPSPKSDPPSPKQTPPSPDDRKDLEEELHSTTQADKLKTDEEQEEENVDVVASDAQRDRTSTNESNASSCLEGGEKKTGKFKLFKNKFKGVSVKEKKEEPAIQKDPKEKKRRGSNAFSVLLQGKKSKEDSKKPDEVDPQPSQVEDRSGPRTAPHPEVTPPSESPPTTPTKKLSVPVVPTVDVQVTPPCVPQPSEEEPQRQQDAFLATLGIVDDETMSLRTTVAHGEARDSYSRISSGSRDDVPPSIPEKTYIRASSPNHDVPKNNRPVTNLHLMAAEEFDDEDEASQRVDGYITEKQIEAMLMAKENREKRKRSLSRPQVFVKPDVVKGTSLASQSNEDWVTKRTSYNSFSSIDSDDPFSTTNFLSFEPQSSSSSSIRGLGKTDGGELSSGSFSESGNSVNSDVESPTETQRRPPRFTDAIAAKNRVSLTSPEFTVMEEESLGSPETPKARPTQDNNVEDEDADKEQHDSVEDEPEAKDFFPVAGRDVQFRPAASVDLPTGNLRTSGIVSLKEYLEAQEEVEDLQEVKSGISRLGHSAAVEKLKQTTSEQ